MDAVSIRGRPPTVKSVQRPAIEQKNPDVTLIAGHFSTNGREIFRLSRGLIRTSCIRLSGYLHL